MGSCTWGSFKASCPGSIGVLDRVLEVGFEFTVLGFQLRLLGFEFRA